MSIKALQEYTYVSKYARYNADKKRRETWDESCERVFDMHIEKYPEIREELEWAFQQVRERRVLGSQRALQFGGIGIKRNHARLYNCTVSFCDRLRFFQECFWLLLCGSGTGFSVQKHHIAKLPSFSQPRLAQADGAPSLPHKTYVIPDSIEGWADALGVLLSSYFEDPVFPEYANCVVDFDYSQIRKEGSPLSSSSGKAPGPEPLRRSLEVIRRLLDERIDEGQTRLRPIDAYDVVMHASDAVLSGGVRRSATICIFSYDDNEMIHAKTGNWFRENPQRGRSNNSALLLRDGTSKEEFFKLINSVRQWGEPGFYWSDSTEQLPNPCVEIGMWPVDIDTLKSGWQFCNLCEINGKKCRTEEDFAIAARAAAIIGTAQAGYTSFPYLGETTEKIVRREALLGVSITGMMENPDVLFDGDLQRKMAQLIKDVNEVVADKIGINVAARCTCIKPAGTTSCILGTSSGIHPHHAKRYFRRVQANKMEAPFQYFSRINPLAVEDSVWSANKKDAVITFCVEVESGAKTKNQIDAVDLLEYVMKTQQNWVMTGKRVNRCTQPWLTHNVSNTITVREDEWDEVAEFIYNNREYFAGISLLPASGDKDYPQAPFTTVYLPTEIVSMYGEGALFASGLIVDGLAAFDNNLWAACDAALGYYELSPVNNDVAKYESQLDWVRRAKQFAARYFYDNVKNMTYCLKDVSNHKLWCDLNREYKDVDYTELFEEHDETKPLEAQACAGGLCEIKW